MEPTVRRRHSSEPTSITGKPSGAPWRTACEVCRSAITSLAPDELNTASISVAVYELLIGTATRPARSTPKYDVTNSRLLPSTIATYLANVKPASRLPVDHAAFRDAEENVRRMTKKFLESKGTRTPASYHKELGKIMWDYCGMARNKKGLEKALQLLPELRENYWKNVRVLGEEGGWNQSLESAGRVADFIELGELMCRDALTREESCGGHFREEYQYTGADPETQQGLVNPGDVKRRDDQFAHVSAWEFGGEGRAPVLNKEPLVYEEVKMSTRSYK